MTTTVDTPAAYTWIEAQAGARAVSPGSSPLRLLGGALAATDAGVVLLSSTAAYLVRHGMVTVPQEVAATTLLATVLTVNLMGLSGCYTRHVIAPLGAQIGRAMQGWSVVFLILVVIAYLAKVSDDFSRAWAVGWYVAALFGIALVRAGAAAKVRQWRRRGKLARTVAVVDLAGTGDALARRLVNGSKGEMRLVGVFSMQPGTASGRTVTDLLAVARLFRIDEVIIAAPREAGDLVDAAIRTIATIPAHVRLCLDMPRTTAAPLEAALMYGEPVITVRQRPMMGWSRVAKRTEDLVLASLALVLVAPLMGLVALLIKLDSPGPVLFRQARLGFNNNVITVYKFRTMVHRPAGDADVRQAQRNDKRFTRIGQFLRRTSIDELPQLFNVLQDGMSLVGPRPHALAHNDQYAALIDGYLGRHRVQPGITGWAQVNGFRGETDTLDKMQRRVEHDLDYIDRWSLMLDLRILFMTVFTSLLQKNAY